jgi:sec-independent protein translocase protein TatA
MLFQTKLNLIARYGMRSIGMPELLMILGVAVLLFGGKKIPEVAKGLGQGIRNFKTALKEDAATEVEKA